MTRADNATMRHKAIGLAATLLWTAAASAEAPPPRPAVVAAFHAVIDRPAVELRPQTRPMADFDGLARERFTFVAEPGQVVPCIAVKAKADAATRLPVVIVLHGTGGFKEQNLTLLAAFARRGFLAVAPDGRYHGERCAAGKGTVDYFAAITQAYRDGRSHPWLFDTVYDVGRLVDYLQTRPDVDAARIGLMGFSKGGMETYLAAATDPRITAAVPCISVQSFAWELEHDQWRGRIGTVRGAFDAAAKLDGVETPDAAFVKKFYDRLVPGIDGVFDGPSVVPLICPRPLLVINGDSDDKTPLPGVKLATDAAAAAYAKAGVAERFRAEVEAATGHTVTPTFVAEAVDWLTLWLNPAAVVKSGP